MVAKESVIAFVESVFDTYRTKVSQDPSFLRSAYFLFSTLRPGLTSGAATVENVLSLLESRRVEMLSTLEDSSSPTLEDSLDLIPNLPGFEDAVTQVLAQFPEISDYVRNTRENVSAAANRVLVTRDLSHLSDFERLTHTHRKIPGVSEMTYDLAERLQAVDFPLPFLHQQLSEFVLTDLHRRLLDGGKDPGQIQRELQKAIGRLAENMQTYSDFFLSHPELRGTNDPLRHIEELRDSYPFLRRVFALNAEDTTARGRSGGKSTLCNVLEMIYVLQGNFDFYKRFEEELRKADSKMGIVFEKDLYGSPSEMLLYLLPYWEKKHEIQPYLNLLRHGDIVGFASATTAQINGKKFVDVETFQTDFLRKDKVVNGEVVPNDDGYTVPGRLRRPYLHRHEWAVRILRSIEAAARSLSDELGIAGIIIPTWPTILEQRFGAMTSYKRAVQEGNSGYASRIYNELPPMSGFDDPIQLEVHFPLKLETRIGTYWVKSFK